MTGRDRFKIVITGSFLPHKDRERELLADIADVVVEDAMSRDALLDLARDADAIMTDIMPIDAGVMAHAPKLRAIVVYGAGTDRVDTAAAAERGGRLPAAGRRGCDQAGNFDVVQAQRVDMHPADNAGADHDRTKLAAHQGTLLRVPSRRTQYPSRADSWSAARALLDAELGL